MSVARPRSRLVYFRVSEDEFQKLSSMCDGAEGARSISELARSAVNRMIAGHNGEKTCTVDQKIEKLQAQIQVLTDLLTANRMAERPDDSSAEPQMESGDLAAQGAASQ